MTLVEAEGRGGGTRAVETSSAASAGSQTARGRGNEILDRRLASQSSRYDENGFLGMWTGLYLHKEQADGRRKLTRENRGLCQNGLQLHQRHTTHCEHVVTGTEGEDVNV